MTTQAQSQLAGLASLTARMLASGKYSDLTIKCHELVLNVHRNVVCLQSDVLAAMVDGPFKEASTGVIDLEDDNPDVVMKVVEFLYSQDYTMSVSPASSPVQAVQGQDLAGDIFAPAQKKGKKGRSSVAQQAQIPTGATEPTAVHLLLVAQIYVAGDKYNIPALKTLSRTKFEAGVESDWNSAAFVASLELVYDNTPESDRLLKDVALQAVAKNVRSLMDRGEFVKLCKTHPEISFDVLGAHLKLYTEKACCSSCQQTHPSWSPRSDGNIYIYCNRCGRNFVY